MSKLAAMFCTVFVKLCSGELAELTDAIVLLQSASAEDLSQVPLPGGNRSARAAQWGWGPGQQGQTWGPGQQGQTWGWGHGQQGETCCMCSQQSGGPTGTVVIYAVEDYDHAWAGQSAYWHCQDECERKCNRRVNSHMFGCLDEQHLRSLGGSLGTGFQLTVSHQFGNLC